VSRGTNLCSCNNLYSLYNIWKDQLRRISGSECYECLFGPETFSGLLGNKPELVFASKQITILIRPSTDGQERGDQAVWPNGYEMNEIWRSRVQVPLWPPLGFEQSSPWLNSSAVLQHINWSASCQLGFLTSSFHLYFFVGPHQPRHGIINYLTNERLLSLLSRLLFLSSSILLWRGPNYGC